MESKPTPPKKNKRKIEEILADELKELVSAQKLQVELELEAKRKAEQAQQEARSALVHQRNAAALSQAILEHLYKQKEFELGFSENLDKLIPTLEKLVEELSNAEIKSSLLTLKLSSYATQESLKELAETIEDVYVVLRQLLETQHSIIAHLTISNPIKEKDVQEILLAEESADKKITFLSLKRQRLKKHKNLMRVKEQIAIYVNNPPLDLLSAQESLEDEILELEQELSKIKKQNPNIS